MRDIVITLIVFGSLPLILKRPYIGAGMWVWISVMNPHRLSWGFAYTYPFAAIIAAVTIVSLVISKEPKKLPMTPITITLITFTFWMIVTTAFALWQDESFVMLQRVVKIMIMTCVTIMLIKKKEHVQMMVWTLVGSLAYYGIKGGVFTLLSGGNSIVWGPEGSYIEGNNEVALALITIIPIMYYLHLEATHRYVRIGMLVAMGLCAMAAIGSYSRGALVGIAAMLLFLWIKSPKKILMGTILIILVPIGIAFMPAKWSERMDTINTYKQDSSAMGRINAWNMTFNLASDRPLVGGGFEIYNRVAFARYAPDPGDIHAAHSIYFQALGEHGFVGLFLYLMLAFHTWRKGRWIVRNTTNRPDYRWAGTLATMIQVSMVGFAVGGAFLSLLYYDVPYYLMALMVCLGVIVEKGLAEEKKAGARAVLAVPAQALAHV